MGGQGGGGGAVLWVRLGCEAYCSPLWPTALPAMASITCIACGVWTVLPPLCCSQSLLPAIGQAVPSSTVLGLRVCRPWSLGDK